MVVLKKIKASSLNEVLIATIIIVVVFGISVAILNNLMFNIVNKNTQDLDSKMNELIYSYKSKKIKLPYNLDNDSWLISIDKLNDEELLKIEFEILSKRNGKTLTKQIISSEES